MKYNRFLAASLLAILTICLCYHRSRAETPAPVKRNVYRNILIIGNSITRHGLAPYWWGNWGMAASTREKDYVHILIAKLREQNPSMGFSVLQAANWERNHKNFDLSVYDSLFTNKPDLVVIRLGENVGELNGYENSYLKFLNYIKEKSPGARIVATGNFWPNEEKDLATAHAATSAGILFIPLTGLGTKENKSSLGAVVMGDDGLKHTIDHQGVADHPGDIGMERIADKIFNFIP